MAAREADFVGFSGITFARGGTAPDLAGFRAAAVDDRVRLVREVAGARLQDLELNVLVQRVVRTEDRRGAAAELGQRWPSALSTDDILASPFVLLGSIEEIAAQLIAHRRRWGFSYYIVFDDVVDAFAPIVARLNGLQ